MTFEEICQKLGRRFKKYVYYYDENNNRVDISADDIERVKIFFNASVIGSLMKGAELDLKNKLTISDDLYIDVKATFGSNSVTKTYGPYYVKEESYSANDKVYTYKLYDEMLKTMVDYKAVTITYPCTIQDYFKALLDELGLTTSISLTNGSLTMTSDIYDGINYTYRSVLEDIAVANGILIYIENGEVKVATLDDSTIATIDDDILKNSNIDFGEHFGTINTLVLSRAGGSDNIYYPETLPETPVEFKISDNQLMNDNNRVNFMPNLFAKVNGINYDIYDTELVGYGGFKPLQKVIFVTGGNTFTSYVFNNEMEWTDSFTESIYTDMPDESVTDYSASDTTDQRINQAYIIVNKQEQEIQSLAEKVVEVSKTVIGNGSVTLENAHEGILHHLEFYGSINLLFPSETLYPSTTLYPKGGNALQVDETIYDLDLANLNYMNATTYDKYVYDEGKQWIERNVGIDSEGNMYKLDETIIEEKEDINIEVKSSSKLTLIDFMSAKMTCIYLTKNDYTDVFATTVDVKSEIKQSADNINLSVTEKLEGVSDEDGNVTSASILLAVNDGESSTQIVADKISLEGYTTINDSFKITEDGYMDVDSNVSGIYNYNSYDHNTCQALILESQYDKLYDYNEDGKVNAYDLLKIQKVVSGEEISTKNVNSNYIFDSTNPKECIRAIYNNEIRASLGIGGIQGKNVCTENLIISDGTNFSLIRPNFSRINGSLNVSGALTVSDGGGLYVDGDFTVTGEKNRAIKIDNGDYVKMNAYETATPYFGDIGSNKTDSDGYCKIEIEDIFSQTIEMNDYKVFIQECGDGKLYVKKFDTYFEVKGTPNIDFDWEIKAIQKGYKNIRLEKFIKEGE